MSILRNGHVVYFCCIKASLVPVEFNKWPCPCHYLSGLYVAVAKVRVALSNLRNSHVALSILGVNLPVAGLTHKAAVSATLG